MELSPNAKQIIHDYFNLPFNGVEGVRCPYFNNASTGHRAQLRVLAGKGTPREIAEEAQIISIQYKKGIFDRHGHCCLHDDCGASINTDCIRNFLIDNTLGVDCSGLVTHILAAHYSDTKQINFPQKMLHIPFSNPFAWLLAKLRPVERIGVRAYADDRNSKKIAVADLRPADIVTMLATGPQKKRNHILLITEKNGDEIKYISSRAWSSEGKYGHGVSEGIIKITNPQAGLLEQAWTENGKSDEENGTYLEAKNAKTLEVRRIVL